MFPAQMRRQNKAEHWADHVWDQKGSKQTCAVPIPQLHLPPVSPARDASPRSFLLLILMSYAALISPACPGQFTVVTGLIFFNIYWLVNRRNIFGSQNNTSSARKLGQSLHKASLFLMVFQVRVCMAYIVHSQSLPFKHIHFSISFTRV